MIGSGLTARLGLGWPIVQAPMAGFATVDLAAEVCKAGGLGSLGLAGAKVADAAAAITNLREKTAAPFQVNFFCHEEPHRDPTIEAAWLGRLAPAFNALHAAPPSVLTAEVASFRGDAAMLRMLLDLRPPVVSFHLGLPDGDVIAALRLAGIELIVTITSCEEARAAQAAGIDIVVAQGYEAGGHRGIMDLDRADSQLDTECLLRSIRAVPGLSIISAGGVMHGADIRRLIKLGAGAVQLGTAFLLCDEAGTPPGHRAALKEGGRASVMTRSITGRPARALVSTLTAIDDVVDLRDIPDFPLPASASGALAFAARAHGSSQYDAVWAGSGHARARVSTVSALLNQFVDEMDGALEGECRKCRAA